MKKHLLVLLLLTYFTALATAAKLPAIDLKKAISGTFEELDKTGNYCENLSQADMNVLPIGLKQTISNNEFTIAISSVKILDTHAELTVFARMRIPQKDQTLIFAAQDIKFSYDGNFIGDPTLVLLNDLKIPIGGSTELTLKGSLNEDTGRSVKDLTYVKIECDGFKELSVCGEVLFSKDMIEKVNSNGKATGEPVISSFKTVISDWNDLLLELTVPSFQIKGLEGFVFNVQQASIDLSDYQNPTSIKFPPRYVGVDNKNPELWRGVYFRKFAIMLPEEFSKEGKRISIEAQNMLIDEQGISGKFDAKNLLSIEQGDASGWAFSVDEFMLELNAHQITSAGFRGMIGLPVSENQTLLNYEAIIGANNSYSMKVALKDSLSFNFLAAKAVLKENSYVKLERKDGKFRPEACLSGYMDIGLSLEDSKNNNTAFKDIEFTNLVLKTEVPYLKIGYLGYHGEVGLFGFPLSISNIALTAPDSKARLGFDLNLNLDDKFVNGSTRLEIECEYLKKEKQGYWKYTKTNLSAIKIRSEIAGTLTISGEIAVMKNDPTYGDGFKGGLSLEFKKPIDGLIVKANAIFGKVGDHRYWYVDGVLGLPGVGFVIPPTPLAINGFGGGISNGMKKAEGGSFTSPSGCLYVPDPKMGIGLKAAVLYNIGSKAVKGDASFEIEFYKSGGIRYIGFFGSALFMEGNAFVDGIDNMVKGKLSKLVSAEKLAASGGEDREGIKKEREEKGAKSEDIMSMSKAEVDAAAMAAYVGISYNFENKEFHANFEFYVNLAGGIVRGVNPNNLAGYAVLHIDPSTWYLHMGTPQVPVGLAVGIPGVATVESKSYFMMGSHIPDAMAPPGRIADILGRENIGIDGSSRSSGSLIKGSGFAFGSSLGIDTGDLQFLILYANFYAGVGFDIMLMDYGNMQCQGRSGTLGFNGWYAKGQAYTYLGGELGVKVNLLFIKGKFPIIRAGVAAMLQAQLPNPVWMQGNLGVHFNLLGGLVKGNMRFKFSLGEKCNMTYPGAPPIDIMMIGDMTPVDRSPELDVFTAPQLTLTVPEGKTFSVEEGGQSYRVVLKEFAVYDGSRAIPGELKWNRGRDVVTFYSHDILPAKKNLVVKAGVAAEEYVNGSWRAVPGTEKREAGFTTGDAPTTIPLHNIAYSYPVVDQQYYYPKESQSGYVVLKQGQPELFDSKWDFKCLISSNNSTISSTGYSYDQGSKKISFSLPQLSRSNSFKVDFQTNPKGSGSQEGGNTKEVEVYSYDSENTVSQSVTEASNVVNAGEAKSILNYAFASSNYETFKAKVSDANKGGIYPMGLYGDEILMLYQYKAGMEPFERIELEGNPAGDFPVSPLIETEAVPTDNYYTKTIYPLLYENYPINGYLTVPRYDSYGVPPLKAIGINQFNGYFPYSYLLPLYYFIDFEHTRNLVKNFGVESHPLYDSTKGFPVLQKGTYKISLQYSLPGGITTGTKAEFNYKR